LFEKNFPAWLKQEDSMYKSVFSSSNEKWEVFLQMGSFSSIFLFLPIFHQEKAVNSSSKASSVWPGEINKNVNKEKQKKSWLMKKLEPVTRSRIEFKNICLVMASAEN